MVIRSLLAGAALAACAWSVQAQVVVTDPWVRATVKEQKATGAFMQITSPDAARLVEVKSPAAAVVEVHEMSMVDNTMRMRAVSGGLELPAGQPVALRPGSYHVMLIDLKAPLAEGDSVPLTLVVEHADKKRETVEVKAAVRGMGAMPMQMQHQHMQ